MRVLPWHRGLESAFLTNPIWVVVWTAVPTAVSDTADVHPLIESIRSGTIAALVIVPLSPLFKAALVFIRVEGHCRVRVLVAIG